MGDMEIRLRPAFWRSISVALVLLVSGCGGGGDDPNVISGEIRVAPELASEVPRNSLLIIQARETGSGARSGGQAPVVAEQRVRNPKFPLRYFLGKPDVKSGRGGLSGSLVISARIIGDELSGDTAKPVALEGRSKESAPGGGGGRRGVDILIQKKVPIRFARKSRGGDGAGSDARSARLKRPVPTGTRVPAGTKAASAKSISGAITVAPSLGPPPKGGVVFIVVRPAGRSGGPPLAVKRVANTGFPMRYRVSGGDVMIQGMPFQGSVSVKVRLDGDGRVGVQPGDLEGSGAKPVPVGSVGVDIVLDKRH